VSKANGVSGYVFDCAAQYLRYPGDLTPFFCENSHTLVLGLRLEISVRGDLLNHGGKIKRFSQALVHTAFDSGQSEQLSDQGVQTSRFRRDAVQVVANLACRLAKTFDYPAQ
jgi:hypothetical protein